MAEQKKPKKNKSTKDNIVELGKDTQFKTGAKQAEIARRGGIRSGQVKRENKILREEILKRLSAQDMKEITDNLIARAKDNDRSFEVLRDTIGQKPTDKAEVTTDITIVDILKGNNIEL